ncbi:MAG: DUF59 domain-containing protein [Firmicutes bacterium]|nr:DUF59 domain-containing protein [Bacillota bacterium]
MDKKLIRMSLVKDIEMNDGGKVRLTFRPSSPVCPMAFKLEGDIHKHTAERIW